MILCSYFKYDAGQMLAGAFEPQHALGRDGIPMTSASAKSPATSGHFEPRAARPMRRIPALEKAGIQKFFAVLRALRPMPLPPRKSTELKNLFSWRLGNSIGCSPAGDRQGVSEWIRMGTRRDLWEVDFAQHAVQIKSQICCKPGCLKAWVC